MRIVVHGQQAFGKAVLEALLKRGDEVVAVYVAPEKEGAKADPLKEAALAASLPVYQPASYRKPEVWAEFKALKRDQLADHPGRYRNRTVDFLARQRPRDRRRSVAEEDPDLRYRLARLGLFR